MFSFTFILSSLESISVYEFIEIFDEVFVINRFGLFCIVMVRSLYILISSSLALLISELTLNI